MNKYQLALNALDKSKVKYTMYEGGFLWGKSSDSKEVKEREKVKGLKILERYGV